MIHDPNFWHIIRTYTSTAAAAFNFVSLRFKRKNTLFTFFELSWNRLIFTLGLWGGEKAPKQNGIFPFEPTRNAWVCSVCIDAYYEQMCEFFLPFGWITSYMQKLARTQTTLHLPIDSRRGLTASNTNLRTDDVAAAVADDDDGDSCWCVCGRYFGLRCSKYPLAGDVLPPLHRSRSRSLLALVEAKSKFDVGDGVE